MSTPSQAPKSPAFSPESVRNVRGAVVATEGGVASIHRNVSVGVDSAITATPASGFLSENEMRETVLKKVQNLPPLPKTIVDIYALRRSDDPDIDKLLQIIKGDPMTTTNLIKISNSVIYGLSQKVKTPAEALRMLGYRMAINVAMSTTMSAHLKPDLSPYGIDVESFTETSALQSSIIEKWNEPQFAKSQSDLQFAAFLQEVGALVISKIAVEKGSASAFRAEFSGTESQSGTEKKFFGLSAPSVTSIVFTEWKFNREIIDFIEGADDPESAAEDVLA